MLNVSASRCGCVTSCNSLLSKSTGILTMADAIVRIEVLIMKLCTKLDVKC